MLALGVYEWIPLVLRAAIEREQLLQEPVVRRELDHGPVGWISAYHVASFEKGGQQRAGLSAAIEWRSGNGHRSSPFYVLAQPWG